MKGRGLGTINIDNGLSLSSHFKWKGLANPLQVGPLNFSPDFQNFKIGFASINDFLKKQTIRLLETSFRFILIIAYPWYELSLNIIVWSHNNYAG